jgi:hypothetical protein
MSVQSTTGDTPAATPLEVPAGQRQPDAGAATAPDPAQARRVVAVLAVLSLGALWLQHHLGFDFKDLGIVALTGAVWGGIGQLANLFDEQSGIGKLAENIFKAPLRAGLLFLAQPIALYCLAGLLALMMTTLSSVTIRSDVPGEHATISLATLDEPGSPETQTMRADQPVVHFRPVLTSPFGRLYQLDAEGYVPAQLTVFPFVGRQVLLGRDLVPSPSVLFRPFAEGIAALEDGAVFSVKRVRGGKEEQLIAESDSGSASAFLLGRPKPISDAMMMFWNLEATASQAPDAIKARLVMLWRSPHQLPMQGELAPHDCLVAEIRLHDKLKARAVALLGDESFADVLMQDVDTARVKGPSC